MRHIPMGFYVAVQSETGTQRTSNRPALVCQDIVEWDEEIPLPSEPLAKISLMLHTTFELGERLGTGELLHQVDITVGRLLTCKKRTKFVKILHQDAGSVHLSRFSFEIEMDQRVPGQNEDLGRPTPAVSDEVRQLTESTNVGHSALTRYRELQEQQTLDEAIRHFEHARGLSELDRPSHGTVLFNLATAKLMHCRTNNATPDLGASIDLYRAALCLRPRGHPDHPFVLLSLGVALKARFQRKKQ
ncbi:hypothetical protein JVU11DRAFT_10299 [Chiua virens]|nr:hypothetical protein JVU11DRAFT_10299 [Chiua virens]